MRSTLDPGRRSNNAGAAETKAAAEPTDEVLMHAYLAGDQAAFRQLFERYLPKLLGLARRTVGQEDEAREIVQQAFFQLHNARHDFRRDSRLRPWLYTITMNLIRQHFRRRQRRRESALLEDRHESLEDTGRRIERESLSLRLRRALSRLPPQQREVIELHWLEEQPFAEVAAIVGAKEGAVRVRAHRAYARLRTLLREEAPNDR